MHDCMYGIDQKYSGTVFCHIIIERTLQEIDKFLKNISGTWAFRAKTRRQ
jgi:hypothetical protein